MADDMRERQKRAAEFIEPFRVKPGSKVRLGKDFDPSFKAGVRKKKDGVALLEEGVRLLSEYQARLAAQGSTVLADSPTDFGKLITEETAKWGKVVKFSGMKPD